MRTKRYVLPFAFATFEHRRAFNSFECGDVPFLHLAMKAGGYVAVEKTKPGLRWLGMNSAYQGPQPTITDGSQDTLSATHHGDDLSLILPLNPGLAFATFEHRRAF